MQALIETIQAGYAVYSGAKGAYNYFHPDTQQKIHVKVPSNHASEFKRLHKEYLKHHLTSKLNRGQKRRKHDPSMWQSVKDKMTSLLKKSNPQIKRAVPNSKMAGRRYNKKRTYNKRRSKKIETCFPQSKLVKLKAYHLCSIDPPASSGVAYGIINVNNPLDPVAPGTGFTLTSTEHHPKYWDLYENLYDKFEVLSARVDCHFMGHNNNIAHSYFMVPASTINKDECLTMLTDTNTFAPRLKEAYRRAIVKMNASTSSESDNVKLFNKVNVRSLEGIKKGSADTSLLQGQTLSSGTQAAPTRTPVVYLGVGSTTGGNTDNLEYITCMLKISYVVLFTGLTGDKEGANIV